MKKAPEAFRTISEVSDLLDTPAHVLRFWESKFYQIRPVKRAGGRRYYRPDDVSLLAGIRLLLQDQGMTIRGVQKVLQEQGARHVASLAPHLPARIGPAHEPDETDDADHDEEAFDTVTDDAVLAGGEEGADGSDPVADAPDEAPAETRILHAPVAPKAPEPATVEPASARPGPAPAQVAPPVPRPEVPVRPALPLAVDTVAESDETLDAATTRLARHLREMPRGSLGPRRDRAAFLARRIDVLLDRMSDASGAGRW